MAETIEKIAQPAVVPTESVLVDGIAYDTPAPVAAELLRLHIEAQQAEPAAEPDYKVYAVIDSMGWDLDDAEKDDMYRLCRAMLSAAPATDDRKYAEQWQPIETAPKDGRTVLLGMYNSHGNWRTLRGQYFTREVIDSDWENAEDCDEGWYETSVECNDDVNCWEANPTHWMPLPSPPSIDAAMAASREGM